MTPYLVGGGNGGRLGGEGWRVGGGKRWESVIGI